MVKVHGGCWQEMGDLGRGSVVEQGGRGRCSKYRWVVVGGHCLGDGRLVL